MKKLRESERRSDVVGAVYILHFDPPYKHVRHYTGWTEGDRAAVKARLRRHLSGHGARIIEVICCRMGHGVHLGRIFRQKTRKFERALKKRNHGPLEQFCRVCREQARAKLTAIAAD